MSLKITPDVAEFIQKVEAERATLKAVEDAASDAAVIAVGFRGEWLEADGRLSDEEIARRLQSKLTPEMQNAISAARTRKAEIEVEKAKVAARKAKAAANGTKSMSERKAEREAKLIAQAIETQQELYLGSRTEEVELDDDNESSMLATIETWILPDGRKEDRQLLHY